MTPGKPERRLTRMLRAAPGGAVLEGRDIGTVVFPQAEVKIFLDASTRERARRRYEELCAAGQAVAFTPTFMGADPQEVLRVIRAVAEGQALFGPAIATSLMNFFFFHLLYSR